MRIETPNAAAARELLALRKTLAERIAGRQRRHPADEAIVRGKEDAALIELIDERISQLSAHPTELVLRWIPEHYEPVEIELGEPCLHAQQDGRFELTVRAVATGGGPTDAAPA